MKQLLAVAAMVLGLATPAHATEWIICGDGQKKVTFEILVGMMDYLSIDTVRMEANGKLWSSKDEPGATPVYVAQAFEADDHMMVDIAGDGGAVIASLRVFEAHEAGSDTVEPMDAMGGTLQIPGLGAWTVDCSGP